MKPTKIQEEAINRLRMKDKAVLQMDCRMGKSFIALQALKDQPIAVICPPALVPNWENEIKKAGIKNARIFKNTSKNQFANIPSNYALIVDEAHERNKWKTSQELFRRIKKAKIAYFLTATALINKPIDIYWFLKLCGAYTGNLKDFAVRYNSATIGRFNQLILGEPRNIDELIKLQEHCFIKYTRDLKILKHVLPLGNTSIGTDNMLQNYSIIQSLIALEKGRDENVKNHIRALKKKHKKMLFLYFHKSIRDALADVYIDGTVPIRKRYDIIEGYKKEKEGIIWLNYKSCGRGVEISSTDAVVFLEQTFSPSLDYQAYMRAYGFERKEPLNIYYLTYEDVQRMIVSERKKEQLSNIMRY